MSYSIFNQTVNDTLTQPMFFGDSVNVARFDQQKFVDQSISTNTHYDPSQFEGRKVPMKLFLMDLLKAYKYGIKTLYYHTTRDVASDNQNNNKSTDDDCEDGACEV